MFILDERNVSWNDGIVWRKSMHVLFNFDIKRRPEVSTSRVFRNLIRFPEKMTDSDRKICEDPKCDAPEI